MWIKHLFLGFIGLASGVGVAAGTFAFIIVIGVVPRMIAKCNRAENTILFENMIVLVRVSHRKSRISATFKQHICDMQFNVVAVALKS